MAIKHNQVCSIPGFRRRENLAVEEWQHGGMERGSLRMAGIGWSGVTKGGRGREGASSERSESSAAADESLSSNSPTTTSASNGSVACGRILTSLAASCAVARPASPRLRPSRRGPSISCAPSCDAPPSNTTVVCVPAVASPLRSSRFVSRLQTSPLTAR